jgi:hypothetical protein
MEGDDESSESGVSRPPACIQDGETQPSAVVEVRASPVTSLGWALAAACLALPPLALVPALAVSGAIGVVLLAPLVLLPLLLFGYPALLHAAEPFRRTPRILLDEEGIRDRHLGLGKIPWEDVEGVELGTHPAHTFLMLRDPERWIARLPFPYRVFTGVNRFFGYPPFLVNLIGTGTDPEDFRAEVRRRADTGQDGYK